VQAKIEIFIPDPRHRPEVVGTGEVNQGGMRDQDLLADALGLEGLVRDQVVQASDGDAELSGSLGPGVEQARCRWLQRVAFGRHEG
jgi:hypothetical protein